MRASYKWRGVGLPFQYNPWQIITEFALRWHNSEDFVSKAKKDFGELHRQYNKACKILLSKGYPPQKLDNSLSWQNFHGWLDNHYCFYVLIFPGFRHTALRELRFHFESSVRAYYVDTKFDGKTYEEKVRTLTIFKPMKRRTEEEVKLLQDVLEKQYEKLKSGIPFS